MATYLLSVHHREGDAVPSEAEMERAFAQVDALNEELRSSGAWVFAGGLQAPDTARVVRGRGDAGVITDGPYLESKEHLGGFWLIDADDLDAALDWAGRATTACMAPVEVLPATGFSDVAPTAEGLPEFLLSVHVGGPDTHAEADARPVTDEEQQESWAAMQELESDLQATGRWMFSARLADPGSATVVSERNGETVLTDGPFAESKEHLAGFYVIGAEDLDEALDVGRRVTACVGEPIEVRPFQVEPSA